MKVTTKILATGLILLGLVNSSNAATYNALNNFSTSSLLAFGIMAKARLAAASCLCLPQLMDGLTYKDGEAVK